MAKFLSKINSPDYINNKIVKIDEDNNLNKNDDIIEKNNDDSEEEII